MLVSQLSRFRFPTALMALSGMALFLISPVPTLAHMAEAEAMETEVESPENSDFLKPAAEEDPLAPQSVGETSPTEEVTEESYRDQQPTANSEENQKGYKGVTDMINPAEVHEELEPLP